jgi:hypothetical protein
MPRALLSRLLLDLQTRNPKWPREKSLNFDGFLPPVASASLSEEKIPPIHVPHFPVGGRLYHFLPQWSQIISENGFFRCYGGSRTSVLVSTPLFGSSGFVNDQRPGEKSLLQKNVLEEVSLPLGCFFSRLFLVPKKNGQMRPVLELSVLSQCLQDGNQQIDQNFNSYGHVDNLSRSYRCLFS